MFFIILAILSFFLFLRSYSSSVKISPLYDGLHNLILREDSSKRIFIQLSQVTYVICSLSLRVLFTSLTFNVIPQFLQIVLCSTFFICIGSFSALFTSRWSGHVLHVVLKLITTFFTYMCKPARQVLFVFVLMFTIN